jgi:phosphate/sulfate permease
MPKWLQLSKTEDNSGVIGIAIGIAVGVGTVVALFLQFCPIGFITVPALRKLVEKKKANGDFELTRKKSQKVAPGEFDVKKGDDVEIAESETDKMGTLLKKYRKQLKLDDNGDPLKFNCGNFVKDLCDFSDIENGTEDNKKVQSIKSTSDNYDPETEYVFTFIQVFTACVDSLGHGANDVANAIAPLAAVVAIYGNPSFDKKVSVPLWITALGGAGIVCGLALYGRNILRALGCELIKMSPSRGFNIELGAALVIVVGSMLGIPLSTTHCQVGAETAVGMVDGIRGGVNFPFLAKIAFGWVFTLIFVGVLSAGLFNFAVHSPSMAGFEGVRTYHMDSSAFGAFAAKNMTIDMSLRSFYTLGEKVGEVTCVL